MADKQNPNVLKPSTFYSVVSQVFVSMFLVLLASHKSEDNWFFLFMIVYLVLMQVLYLVGMFLARRQEKAAKVVSGEGDGR